MILTDFQKIILNDIVSENITDMHTFIKTYIKVWTSIKNQFITIGSSEGNNVENEKYIYKVMNEEEALSQLQQFVVLWSKLEKANLIYSHPMSPPPGLNNIRLVKQDGKIYTKAMHIASFYSDKEIITLPELSDFIRNNFMTFEEMQTYKEEEFRNKSLKLTRTTAYISLAISAILAILISLFNYLTYKTDRNVTIKNTHAFSDTTKIILLNNESFFHQKDGSGKVTNK